MMSKAILGAVLAMAAGRMHAVQSEQVALAADITAKAVTVCSYTLTLDEANAQLEAFGVPWVRFVNNNGAVYVEMNGQLSLLGVGIVRNLMERIAL